MAFVEWIRCEGFVVVVVVVLLVMVYKVSWAIKFVDKEGVVAGVCRAGRAKLAFITAWELEGRGGGGGEGQGRRGGKGRAFLWYNRKMSLSCYLTSFSLFLFLPLSSFFVRDYLFFFLFVISFSFICLFFCFVILSGVWKKKSDGKSIVQLSIFISRRLLPFYKLMRLERRSWNVFFLLLNTFFFFFWAPVEKKTKKHEA